MSTIEQDKDLLLGIAAEDNGALTQLYKQHYNMVQAMVLANNGSKDDAADLFQEVTIVLYQKLKLGNFELSAQLKTYLYSVAKRIWLRKLQQQQRFTTSADYLADTIAVEDEVNLQKKMQADFDLMDAAMGKVGEPCKSLLQAYYLQKKDMNTIATEFGYTNADNAKTQKYKCLVRLKKLFFAQYKYEA